MRRREQLGAKFFINTTVMMKRWIKQNGIESRSTVVVESAVGSELSMFDAVTDCVSFRQGDCGKRDIGKVQVPGFVQSVSHNAHDTIAAGQICHAPRLPVVGTSERR